MIGHMAPLGNGSLPKIIDYAQCVFVHGLLLSRSYIKREHTLVCTTCVKSTDVHISITINHIVCSIDAHCMLTRT